MVLLKNSDGADRPRRPGNRNAKIFELAFDVMKLIGIKARERFLATPIPNNSNTQR